MAAASVAATAAIPEREWTVPQRTLYKHFLGGACRAGSHAVLEFDPDTGIRTLKMDSRAISTGNFNGCKARVRFTLSLFDHGSEQAYTVPHVRNIPTACSVTDPSCSNITHDIFEYQLGDEEELVDLTGYGVERR